MASKILVVQLTRLGDLLQTTPLISGLRERNPDAFIAALVNKRFEKAVAGHPDLNDILLLDADFLASWHAGHGKDFISGHQQLSELAGALRAIRFDRVINASFNDVGATVSRLIGAKDTRGFVTRTDGSLDSPDFVGRYFHTEIQGSHFPQLHVADVLQCLGGFPPRGKPYTPARGDGGRWGRQFLAERCVTAGEVLIAVQPGSNSTRKGLPSDFVASLASRVLAGNGRRMVILGSVQEREIFNAIQRECPAPLIDATGVGWDELGSLMPHLAALVTGDTAPAHLATAHGVHVVAIFRGESHYSITGPYGNGHWALDPPAGSESLPPVDAVARMCEAAIDRNDPPLLPGALGGWRFFRSEFGPDGWHRYHPHRATVLTEEERIGRAMLDWWKSVLLAEIGLPTAVPVSRSLPQETLPPSSTETIQSSLTQAEVLLQETIMALSTANGHGIRVMDQNDRLLEGLDRQTPGRILSPLIRLLETEKKLVLSHEPSEVRSQTVQAYRCLQERLTDLRRFLTP